MIYSLKKEKWPLQKQPLYEFRLLKNGTIKCTVQDRYELISTVQDGYELISDEKQQYRIPSTSGIRHVWSEDLNCVKNGFYTSLENDLLAAINAFEKHFLLKRDKAQMDALRYKETASKIGKYKLEYLKNHKSATLYEYMMKHPDEYEFTVFDTNYDIETYFYNPSDPEEPDEWETAILELAKLLPINNSVEPDIDEIIIDLGQLIMCHLEAIKKTDLFNTTNIDDIIESMPSILAGNVCQEWMDKFINILKADC